MQLDVQWFVSTLMDNGLISAEDARALNDTLGGEPDLMTFATEFLNNVTRDLSDEDRQSWTEQIQSVLEYAAAQAQTGENSPHAEELGIISAAAETAAAETSEAEEAPAYEPAAPAANSMGTDEESSPDDEIPEVSADDLDGLLAELHNVSAMSRREAGLFMKRMLLTLRLHGVSDLHISANAPLFIRKNLNLQRLDPDWIIPAEDSAKLNTSLLTKEQAATFEENLDLNFALVIRPSRFRAALMMQRQGMSGSYRIVPDKIMTLEELGFLPNDARTLERLLDYHNGLILVTGPIGSGKTTTLAALIEIANQKRQDHVITVEDPIEIEIPSKNCKITQRQIGTDTNSYRTALKGALREDPDIIVIGELNDLETIENAITASETGHLVIGTLPTCDAANTLNRLLDVFPPNQQAQIQAMTAGSLRGVVCQKLIHNTTGGLSICYEILMNTLAVSNVISEGKIFQLRASMQIGSKSGMCTIDQNLLELFKVDRITYETALSEMRDQSVIHQLHMEQAKRVATKGKKKK